MLAYLLGLATLPALALVAYAALRLVGVLCRVANRRGFTMEVRLRSGYEGVTDYTLRNGIWFESPRGPIFRGLWYRVEPKYDEPEPVFVTRWVGLGSPEGPCLIVFHKRHLGDQALPPERIKLIKGEQGVAA